ncbi:hypothetical protein ElyMa_003278600 [Elysia marginata]|uniref:Lebercilin domain-containing protein n=1 Tax=Elysia marginata TaxID=1093978 RepID=A0AAV4J8A2_9GAST|nr:hypothetical protein ElyMa_003278600 [Elysia marginata]
MSSRGSRTARSAHFRISGQALTPGQDRNNEVKSADVCTPRNVIANISPRNASSAAVKEESFVQQVMNINRRLVTQIETLQLKVQIDAKHQEAARAGVKAETQAEVKVKDARLRGLKADLRDKDEEVKNLTDRNHQKESAIQRLENDIQELKADVLLSKGFADDIQSQLDELQTVSTSLESGSAYRQKDENINELQAEVSKLHKNLAHLERELAGAKEKIAQQGTRLRLVDNDRLNIQAKYKEELSRVTLTMRGEIERMRDVMKQQWKEMRNLREQNEDMRSDISEIRNLVLADRLNRGQPWPPQQATPDQAGHFDIQQPSPSLPSLSPKETRRKFGSGRRKY